VRWPHSHWSSVLQQIITPARSLRDPTGPHSRSAGSPAGPLYAYVDADDQHHVAGAELLEIHSGHPVLPKLVVTEVVYLLGDSSGDDR
jgi:hypothetical protein